MKMRQRSRFLIKTQLRGQTIRKKTTKVNVGKSKSVSRRGEQLRRWDPAAFREGCR